MRQPAQTNSRADAASAWNANTPGGRAPRLPGYWLCIRARHGVDTASSLTAKFRSRRRACPQESQVLPTSALPSACGPCRRTLVTPPGTRPSPNHHFRNLKPAATSNSSNISRRLDAGSEGNHRHGPIVVSTKDAQARVGTDLARGTYPDAKPGRASRRHQEVRINRNPALALDARLLTRVPVSP